MYCCSAEYTLSGGEHGPTPTRYSLAIVDAPWGVTGDPKDKAPDYEDVSQQLTSLVQAGGTRIISWTRRRIYNSSSMTCGSMKLWDVTRPIRGTNKGTGSLSRRLPSSLLRGLLELFSCPPAEESSP
ncbi:hypothetical protein PAPYR_5421 [Paratrimastix pyriformis]|uniref:Trimethylguanosine synthase n=1 Tax=Paratrimastix pyriformis TaxID=342808 RepID=A0ABQ8UKE2_9EUKA|nr:hypothetical protein PAPYR_5421 [Paratrimastix pyriformis]